MKDFFKQISIYGILPVVGKFAGFFLIPIYARLFSSAEFGMLELLMTLIKFLLFACSLEFYSAIGRFFYEDNSLERKRKLISTGLILTIATSIMISIASFGLENFISEKYLNSSLYGFEFRLCLVWMLFEAISIYLSVIPRYEKRAKQYVIISVTALLVRITFTILYVLVLDMGIAGVIYGHLTGAIFSLIGYGYASKNYIGINFSRSEAQRIIKFAVPIVPGLLLVGFWGPISRNLISEYFSIATLGLFAFAIRISVIMEVLNSAIRMAWGPMLFENFNKPTFKKDTESISKLVGLLALTGCIAVSLLSPEIAEIMGTREYSESAILIAFLSLAGIIDMLNRLRGFGPLILKKTYILTIAEIIKIIIGVFILIYFPQYGLLTIGFAFLLPAFIKYLILIIYTSKRMKLNFIYTNEIILFCLALFSVAVIELEWNLISRIVVLIVVSIYGLYLLKKNIIPKSSSLK